MSENGQIIERIEDGIALLTIDNPSKKNAVNPAMLQRLRELFADIHARARVVVLRGAGDAAFCTGFDLTAMPSGDDKNAPTFSPTVFDDAVGALADCPLPTIAMVNGHVFGGGGEIAAACDIRIGHPDLKFGMPPAKLGIVYSPWGLQRFAALVGPARAKELFLGARPLSGREAWEWGLFNHLPPADELEPYTMELARAIAQNAPLAVQGMKKVLSRLAAEGLTEEVRIEGENLRMQSFATEDFQEGRRAFIEKRPPKFKGK